MSSEVTYSADLEFSEGTAMRLNLGYPSLKFSKRAGQMLLDATKQVLVYWKDKLTMGFQNLRRRRDRSHPSVLHHKQKRGVDGKASMAEKPQDTIQVYGFSNYRPTSRPIGENKETVKAHIARLKEQHRRKQRNAAVITMEMDATFYDRREAIFVGTVVTDIISEYPCLGTEEQLFQEFQRLGPVGCHGSLSGIIQKSVNSLGSELLKQAQSMKRPKFDPSWLKILKREAGLEADPDVKKALLGYAAILSIPVLLGEDPEQLVAIETTSEDGLSGQLLQYGATQGSATYRNELSKFLSEGYRDTVKSSNLQITAGATQGLHFTASQFLLSGDAVFVEDPTYFIAINVLRDDLGMKVVPVPTDQDGLQVDNLERLILERKPTARQTSSRRPFWGMIYVIPTFNNPTGGCLPEDRCRRLVDVARTHGLLVFCDDVYNLLHYHIGGEPPKRLLAYEKESAKDDNGHVISNGTFSKILGPGLRVGWIEASDRIIHLLQGSNIAWSGGSFNHYGSHLVAHALSTGVQQAMLRDMQQEHANRLEAVIKVLEEKLPKCVRYKAPWGGYFVWLEMPAHLNADDAAKLAFEKYDVQFITGKNCSPSGSYKNCIRFSISYYEEAELVTGVSKMCDALTEYISDAGSM